MDQTTEGTSKDQSTEMQSIVFCRGVFAEDSVQGDVGGEVQLACTFHPAGAEQVRL